MGRGASLAGSLVCPHVCDWLSDDAAGFDSFYNCIDERTSRRPRWTAASKASVAWHEDRIKWQLQLYSYSQYRDISVLSL